MEKVNQDSKKKEQPIWPGGLSEWMLAVFKAQVYGEVDPRLEFDPSISRDEAIASFTEDELRQLEALADGLLSDNAPCQYIYRFTGDDKSSHGEISIKD